MITLTIPDSLIESTVRGIMDNFPEASCGSALVCVGWRYEKMSFAFHDEETGKRYAINRPQLLAAFPLIFTDKWPNGCTPPPAVWTEESADDWLCQCDATDFDAFAQLACLGEVIYG